ncbi:hypothetical protein IAE39_000077 [Pseudomonas sp. S37]|nr:hypothetical protein [Pseudomonas sp. S36]MBK4991903.1 hypothetical protein [Pseudomonas sp. S37]MBK5006317.1 hypothetical protein [Pseudomonas sp. S32]MBK5009518.1 hypothetical protein [Pseudomonas sp. S60]
MNKASFGKISKRPVDLYGRFEAFILQALKDLVRTKWRT